MKSAEQKTKRVRHCFPRAEVYHRFIHSPELCYYEKSRNACGGIDNIFFIGYNIKYFKQETVKAFPIHIQNRAVAIIDRNKKRILISTKYRDHYWNIVKAVPDDYEIYYTSSVIPCYDILSRSKKDLLLQIQTEKLIEDFCNHLVAFHAVLSGKSKVLHLDYKNIFNEGNYKYREILEFYNKHNLSKRKWFNKILVNVFKSNFYRGYRLTTTIKFKPPTLKQIINNTYFNDEEKLKLDQIKFYSDYCYGNSIPFRDVKENWNRTDWNRKLIDKYHFSNVNAEHENRTWNDYVSHCVSIIDKWRRNEIEQCEEKSRQNYENAVDKLKQYNAECNINTVDNWRKHNKYKQDTFSVSYQNYVSPKGRFGKGHWETDYVRNYSGYNYRFPNTQLRLIGDKYIETSRGATVPLTDAIRIFKIFKQRVLDEHKDANLNNLKIGIYNIRYVKYMEKVTDNNTRLGKQEWVFVIGCHHLWLDDIIDFIHYYNLENEFGI